MRNAVQENWLQEESFGSTPGKMATSAILQKVLAIDQLRIERRAGGIFDCDASGCYDRILPPLASVHLQALGLHRTIGIFLARLMFQAKRYVKTAHGVSKQNICTTRTKILHGIGQGNGGGPAMWIAHLTVMFAAISSVCMGFAFSCVEGIRRLCTVGTGYMLMMLHWDFRLLQTTRKQKKLFINKSREWDNYGNNFYSSPEVGLN